MVARWREDETAKVGDEGERPSVRGGAKVVALTLLATRLGYPLVVSAHPQGTSSGGGLVG